MLAVEPPSSCLSEARRFVYVLPCLIEDWLKFGFSRDPLQCVRAPHCRSFEYFDLAHELFDRS